MVPLKLDGLSLISFQWWSSLAPRPQPGLIVLHKWLSKGPCHLVSWCLSLKTTTKSLCLLFIGLSNYRLFYYYYFLLCLGIDRLYASNTPSRCTFDQSSILFTCTFWGNKRYSVPLLSHELWRFPSPSLPVFFPLGLGHSSHNSNCSFM